MAQVQRAQPRRPDRKFGEAIVALAKKQWGSTASVLDAIGYKGDNKNNTLRRLADGEGSDIVARSLLEALKKAKVDTSTLPPMYPGEEPQRNETWREQWIAMGDLLHEHAPKIFEQHFEDLLPLARALAKQLGAELDIFRPT